MPFWTEMTTQPRVCALPPLRLFRDAAAAWSRHNAPRLGAALAYYMVLSLAPLLILATALLGYIYGPAAVRGEVYWQIKDVVGSGAAAFAQSLLKSAATNHGRDCQRAGLPRSPLRRLRSFR